MGAARSDRQLLDSALAGGSMADELDIDQPLLDGCRWILDVPHDFLPPTGLGPGREGIGSVPLQAGKLRKPATREGDVAFRLTAAC